MQSQMEVTIQLVLVPYLLGSREKSDLSVQGSMTSRDCSRFTPGAGLSPKALHANHPTSLPLNVKTHISTYIQSLS